MSNLVTEPTGTMEHVLAVRNLSKSFKGKEVVKGIDLQMKKGELFAMLGPNGAGKTTMIHMLTTLLQPDGGTALVAGYDVVTQADEVRKRISLTGQFAALDEGLSGLQNLEMISRLSGCPAKRVRLLAEDIMQSFGLWEARDQRVGNYSGGMRRRLDIAASIVTRPALIFLDEPTTGLDPQSRQQVWGIVRTLLEMGTSILLTTQYLEEADQLADRIAIINEGRIVAEGTPMALKSSIGGKTLSIQLYDPIATELLQDMLAGFSVVVYRDNQQPLLYKIVVHEARLASEILSTLLTNGVALAYFSLAEPSLDEVFLTITQATEREDMQ